MKKIILSACAFLFVMFSLIMLQTDIYALADDTDIPQLSAVYFDSNGEIADGNKLTSGNYTMQLVIEDMSSISEMEFTASYGSEISIGQYSTIADSDSSFNALCRIDGGSLILCLVSLGDFCTEIEPGTVIFNVEIKVNTRAAVDMNEIFNVSKDPNYFFFETDYNNIDKSVIPYTYDCYALDTDAEKYSYSGRLSLMECDLSPELGYSVTGKIVAMLDPYNPDSYEGAPPLQGVQIIINDEVFAKTLTDGTFTIPFLPNGAYEATLHYQNGFDRKIGIVVSGAPVDCTEKPITMVPCDFDNNGFINIGDTAIYYDAVDSETLDIADIDGNKYINVNDTSIFYSFVDVADIRSIYTEFSIQ